MTDPTARDIMTPKPITVAPDVPVIDAAHLMSENHVGALPVVKDDKVVGIVTEGDLIMQDVRAQFPTYISLLGGIIMYPPSVKRFEEGLKKAVAATVGEVMTAEPVTVGPDATLEDLATLLVNREVSRLPVVEDGRLIGIISKHDLVRSLASEG
jgi:CBS domain-containing protein